VTVIAEVAVGARKAIPVFSVTMRGPQKVAVVAVGVKLIL
jgi:hypothetical protein